jgi:hypothetical protein
MPVPCELSHSPLSETDSTSCLQDVHSPSQPIPFTRVIPDLKALLKCHTNLRLRTKLLLSLVVSTTALACATLVVIRHSARAQVQRQIEEDARNALLTVQAIQHQREMMLSRKANLLATLAYIRSGDPSTVQGASQDPWQAGDCDLFALADRKDKIIALRTTSRVLSVADAGKVLRSSPKEDNGVGWWYVGGRLFQVVLQPYYDDELRKAASWAQRLLDVSWTRGEPGSWGAFHRVT